MPFSKLTQGQSAALMFVVAALSSPKTPQKLKDIINSGDWHTIETILAMGTPSKSRPPPRMIFASSARCPPACATSTSCSH